MKESSVRFLPYTDLFAAQRENIAGYSSARLVTQPQQSRTMTVSKGAASMNPARIELHLHLDGSLNIRWAYEKSIQRGVISRDTTFRQYYERLFASNAKPHSISITKFDLTCSILQEAEDIEDAVYDLARRLHENGIWYAEIRFASQQHTSHGLSQLDALTAAVRGADKAMQKFHDIRINLINCLMHKGDSAAFNEQENQEAILAAEQLYGKGVCGLDLAGYENNCPYREYASLFELAGNKGIPFTMHAGEMGIGSHILDALQMGASRIGHGVNCLMDPDSLNALIETQTPMEICITSNVKRDMNYGGHQILDLIALPLVLTLNSDNMMFARTDLRNEFAQLNMLVSDDRLLKKLAENAVRAAFCDEATRSQLYDRLARETGRL